MVSQKFFLNTLVTVVVIFGVFYWFSTKDETVKQLPAKTMALTSTAFADGGTIPEIYTCDGSNISPPLEFSNIPEGTESLALVVNDPEAPSGNWVHWAVWNIPTSTVGLHAGEKLSGAIQGLTSFGRNGYGGPCPPEGEHQYFFNLYALDTTLNLQAVYGIKLEKTIESHIIQKAELIGKYHRTGE